MPQVPDKRLIDIAAKYIACYAQQANVPGGIHEADEDRAYVSQCDDAWAATAPLTGDEFAAYVHPLKVTTAPADEDAPREVTPAEHATLQKALLRSTKRLDAPADAAQSAYERGLTAGAARQAAPARQPYLGLATTKQLIDELAARARVSAINGETSPAYWTAMPEESK